VGAYSKDELVDRLVDRKTHIEKIEEPEVASTTGINPTINIAYLLAYSLANKWGSLPVFISAVWQ
jgi:hypothetical protein